MSENLKSPMSDNELVGKKQGSMSSYMSATFTSDEIDLRAIWSIFWSGKWSFFLITLVAVLGAALYVFSLSDVYRAETLLSPAEKSDSSISAMGGSLGSLASLAGINLGTRGDNKTVIAIAVLRSRAFINRFISEHSILPQLMAAKTWDREANTIIYDENLYDSENEKWVRKVIPPKQSKPSQWEAYEAFMKILSISQDKETGLVTVSIDHLSPYEAERWVHLLIGEVNAVMKEKDVEEAKRSIEFLQRQLSKVALADMRTVFYQLIEEQTKTIMLAEVRDEYVFSTIDPPVVPETPNGPNRVLIILIGIAIGIFLGLVYVFASYATSAPKVLEDRY